LIIPLDPKAAVDVKVIANGAGVDDDIAEVSTAYVTEQKKKFYLASVYPEMKLADIEVLSQTVTDEEIEQYERDRGNR
jgi:hypothetical protein